MTNKEAYERAVKALHRARSETNSFNNGDYTSWEVEDAIKTRLAEGFRQPAERQ